MQFYAIVQRSGVSGLFTRQKLMCTHGQRLNPGKFLTLINQGWILNIFNKI